VSVAWYAGDAAFGQAALDAASSALARLSAEWPAPLPQVQIYIYRSLGELQSALALAGQPWQGGQARPELGVVLVAIAPGPEAPLHLQQALAHELTHLVLYHAAGAQPLPRWLEEGLAVLAEPLPDASLQVALDAAVRDNALVPLETLCAPFSGDYESARLAYAQSASFVQFIRDQYGRAGLSKLVAAYANGADCVGGVELALGRPLNVLELAWRARLGPGGGWLALWDAIGVWVLLLALMLLAPLPLLAARRKP
jgi:hypothetical protein